MIKNFIIIAILCTCLSGFAKAQATFDVVDYDARIEPDIAMKTVKGKVSIRFTASLPNLVDIQLNAGVLEIDSVTEGKKPLKFEKKDKLLNVTLARPVKFDEQQTIEVSYHSTPKFGIQFFPDQSQVYTVFSTSQWMPCVDAPDDRATFRLNLVVDGDLKVVGNGKFTGQTSLPGNKMLSTWEQKTPVPTYLFGFAAGKFREVIEQHGRIKLRYLGPEKMSDADIKKVFANTGDMLDFYEDKAGVKYADSVYTQVLPAGNAEQEMSSFTVLSETYGPAVLKDEKDVWLGAHEFAHQWWGNMVTNVAWTHFWLNEGIATFMTAAYKEHRFGRAEYMAEIEKSKTRYEKVRDAGKDKSLVFPDWNKPTSQDRTLVYQKGAYVTHLLREELGEEAFWKGLKTYTQKYWLKPVTTADFQKTMESSSDKDLSAFFNKWVYLK